MNVTSAVVKEEPRECEDEEEETVPLSPGNPFFTVVMSRSQVQKPFTLSVPARFYHRLPRRRAPAVLLCRGRSWEVGYAGDLKQKRFGAAWMAFAVDNRLQVGDACVFELMPPAADSVATFRVQVLRGGLPEVVASKGATSDEPIVIVDDS